MQIKVEKALKKELNKFYVYQVTSTIYKIHGRLTINKLDLIWQQSHWNHGFKQNWGLYVYKPWFWNLKISQLQWLFWLLLNFMTIENLLRLEYPKSWFH